jgi:hypothetical protein
MAGPGQFPVVASFATWPGRPIPRTSSLACPCRTVRSASSAMPHGFSAEYTVDVSFMDLDSVRREAARGARVRVRRSPKPAAPMRASSSSRDCGAAGRYIVTVAGLGCEQLAWLQHDRHPHRARLRPGWRRVASPDLVYEAAGRACPRRVPESDHQPATHRALRREPRRCSTSRPTRRNAAPIMSASQRGGRHRLEHGGIPHRTARTTCATPSSTIPAGLLPLGRFWIDVS